MNIMLAPMEGVVDFYMRQTLTALGGYEQCVTEFVRISDRLLPKKVFHKLCPELHSNGKTLSGVPVFVQLLGADPELMAMNAVRAVKLGAPGIDLNFGCPAKCVNKRNGGAILLKEPQRLYDVIRGVRQAVDKNIQVSAKIRLGYESTDLALENAQAVQLAGADFITVHARTKVDGYKAPARWEWLGLIKESLSIPVIANGDITSVEDYIRCVSTTNCENIMVGRGALALPDLARQIKDYQQGKNPQPLTWNDTLTMVIDLGTAMQATVKERYILARQKQWLAMLKNQYSEAISCFEVVRRLSDYSDMQRHLPLFKNPA